MRQLTKFAAKRVVSSKLPANSDVRSVRDSLQVFCYIVWNFEEMHSMQAYLYHWVGGFLQKTLKMRLYAQVYYASVPVPQVEGSCKRHWWRDEWYLLLFAAVSCWCRPTTKPQRSISYFLLDSEWGPHLSYVLCYIMQAYPYHRWRVLAKDMDDDSFSTWKGMAI